VTATTDDKGRWAIIGLSSGEWRFIVEAPGYVTASATFPIRIAAAPPMTFTLVHDPGPLPGALDKNIQQQIAEANTLRDQGRLDQAIAAYDDIRNKNPKLTAVNLVLGDTYRQKAAQENNPGSRQALLTRALSAYSDALKSEETSERAKAGVASTEQELAANGAVAR
jgi:tetratricopeptide (TPR) repeat protein